MRFDFCLGLLALCACAADQPAATAPSGGATTPSQQADEGVANNQQAPVQSMATDSSKAASMTGASPATMPAQMKAMDAAVAAQPADAGRQQPMRADAAAVIDAAHADARVPTGTAGATAAADAGKPAVKGCKPAAKPTDMGVHFHHVGMLSMDPEADMQFYEKYFGAPATEYCRSEDGTKKTLATKTERAWFLYDRATQPPDDRLNSYLEHVGWLHPDPVAELQRLVEAGAPLYPEKRGQCASAAMGTAPCNNYWFYLRAPNGAEIEDALGPGPATMGFGHVHFVMGVDFEWFSKATDGAIKDQLIDQVNHTDVAVEEKNLANEMVVDSRGKSIDHLGYSVADLDAHRARVLAAGLEIAEDISFKPEFGFRSFFLRSEKGIWIELVEDAAFTP